MTRSLCFALIAASIAIMAGRADAQVVSKLLPVISTTNREGDLALNAPGVIRIRLVRQVGNWSLTVTEPTGRQTTVTDSNVERYRVYGDTIELPIGSSGAIHLAATGELTAATWESLIPASSGQQRFRQGGPLDRMDATFRQAPANRTIVGWSDAVVRVRWSGPALETRWCSGVQVAPGTILTNRHCLPPDYDRAAPTGEVAVQFGAFANGLDDIADTVPATVAVAEVSTTMTESYTRDLAILTLTRPPSAQQYANATVPLAAASVTGRQAMLMSVWAYDPPYGKVVSRGPKCMTEIAQEAAWNCHKPIGFYHQCETEEGSSGSPIVDAASGQLIGLHYVGLAENQGNCALRVEEIRAMLQH